MKLSKLLTATLAVLLLLPMLAACGDKPTPEDGTTTVETTEVITPVDNVTIRIGGLTGPTSIGLVGVMEDDANSILPNDYEFTIAGSADELTPKLVKGELDIAAVPANLASVLYNNTNGKIQLLAINTLGVLYIVGKGVSVNSVADLRGQTIYATGKGSTPEYTLRYILTQNGLDPDHDVKLEWKSEPAEIVAMFKSSEAGIAMLPQPYVTVAKTNVEGLNTLLDLTDEWDSLKTDTRLLTGTLVVRRDFAEAHPAALAAFLAEYRASTEYVNANVDDAAALVEKFGIFKAAVAKVAIPECNITFIAGADMKPLIEGYLGVLYEQKPASVGGALPDEDFCYIAK